jgi:uncharacterized RDD family membrane protein YckC
MDTSVEPPPPPSAPPPGPPPRPDFQTVKVTLPWGDTYASFWLRLAGYLIDGVIFGVAYTIISAIAGSGSSPGHTGSGIVVLLGLLLIVAEAAYFIGLWHQGGATVGQRLVRIKVVNESTGKLPTVGESTVRWVGYLISVACIWIGFIWILFDGRHQGWHDKMAHTVVVNAR